MKYNVDFVLEDDQRQILVIEVKAKATLGQEDLKGINELKSLTKNLFKKAIILYQGNQIIPFADDIWAVPVELI